MDELLQTRYGLLFAAYGSGDSGRLSALKARLNELVQDGVLRPDAALFLLSNLDMMLLRPYFGEIVQWSEPGAHRLAQPPFLRHPTDELSNTISIILEALEGERPFSSHAVMHAVEASWRQLSETWGWS